MKAYLKKIWSSWRTEKKQRSRKIKIKKTLGDNLLALISRRYNIINIQSEKLEFKYVVRQLTLHSYILTWNRDLQVDDIDASTKLRTTCVNSKPVWVSGKLVLF